MIHTIYEHNGLFQKQTGVVEDMNFQGLKEKACGNSRGQLKKKK